MPTIGHELNGSSVPYVSLENDTSSASFGIDGTDSDLLKISASSSLGVDPTSLAQITIDPSANGNIVLVPNGSGTVNIDYATQYLLPIFGASGAVQNLADGVGTSGYVLMSNGAGSEPTWAEVSGAGAVMELTPDSGGPVVPTAGGNINLLGGVLLSTSASGGNSITIDLDSGTDGQLIIGSTAGSPAYASLASADSSVTITPGSNTLDLSVDAAALGAVIDFLPDSGTTPVVPDAGGSVTVTGGTTGLTFVGGTNSLTQSGTLVVANGGTGATTLTDHGVLVGSGTAAVTPLAVGTDGQVLLGSSAADPVFATLTSTGGTITFTPGAGSLNLEAAGGGLSWSVVTGTTQAMVAQEGYFANNAGTVTATLPATAAVGDTFAIAGMNNATGWTIAQNAGQTIHFGSSDTTTGVGGSLSSTATYDGVELVCNVANTDFVVVQSIGNITVV